MSPEMVKAWNDMLDALRAVEKEYLSPVDETGEISIQTFSKVNQAIKQAVKAKL